MRINKGALALAAGFVVGIYFAGAQAEDGKALYQKKMCAACHGPDGAGGSSKVPVKGKGKADVTAAIKSGKGKMKPVAATDAEAAAIADYVSTMK